MATSSRCGADWGSASTVTEWVSVSRLNRVRSRMRARRVDFVADERRVKKTETARRHRSDC